MKMVLLFLTLILVPSLALADGCTYSLGPDNRTIVTCCYGGFCTTTVQ